MGGLYRAANDVAREVRSGRVDEARSELRHLVGRDVAQLEPTGICSAAVESVAENVCDSVTAPLFYYAVAGLPGLLAYRMINPADAMVGYREGHEYLGKVAARADDFGESRSGSAYSTYNDAAGDSGRRFSTGRAASAPERAQQDGPVPTGAGRCRLRPAPSAFG